MNMIDYAKAYAALAIYIIATKFIGIGFWHLMPGSRPLWLVGALSVLLVSVFWRRAPERRPQKERY